MYPFYMTSDKLTYQQNSDILDNRLSLSQVLADTRFYNSEYTVMSSDSDYESLL